MTAYNAAASGNAADEFGTAAAVVRTWRSSYSRSGKSTFPCTYDVVGERPLHVAAITPCVHYTMGGIAINPNAQVLSAGSLIPIPGKGCKRCKENESERGCE